VSRQITRHLLGARTLGDGSHQTVMRLSPEQLGEVTVTLEVRAGAVRMDLLAAPAALAALQADLGELRDQLAGSGLDLADVTLRQPDAGGGSPSGRDQPGRDQPGRDQPGSTQPGSDQPDRAGDPGAAGDPGRRGGSGGPGRTAPNGTARRGSERVAGPPPTQPGPTGSRHNTGRLDVLA
jgi:hypothetical protein